MHKQHYWHLLIMIALSYVAMFIFMYAMVDRFANVYPNLNQAYMAGLMAAPMVLIELAVMRAMYTNATLNWTFGIASLVALALFFAGIRMQTGIGDVQFVKSMIPHHSGAILMCNRAKLTDGELKKVCGEIIDSQQREIEQMKAILARMNQ